MTKHVPVLLEEVMGFLAVHPGGTYIDCTFGGGGYTEVLLNESSPHGSVLAIDWNEEAIRRGRSRLGKYLPSAEQKETAGGSGSVSSRLVLMEGNFAQIQSIVHLQNIRPDGIVFDLGISSDLLEEGRGFSYLADEPLAMTFSAAEATRGHSAATLLATSSKEKIAEILSEFGDVRSSQLIAQAIVEERRKNPIKSTGDLRTLVHKCTGRDSFALLSKIFQALRIAVNREFENLSMGLEGAWKLLGSGGRIVVVSFHSGEDRIVKRQFRAWVVADEGRLLTTRPLRVAPGERRSNPRSRSARLRAIEKTA